MNSSDEAYDRERMLLLLTGGDCPCLDDTPGEYDASEYHRSISEIKALIDYQLCLGNYAEVKQLRADLQRARVGKRRAKKILDRK